MDNKFKEAEEWFMSTICDEDDLDVRDRKQTTTIRQALKICDWLMTIDSSFLTNLERICDDRPENQ